MNRCRLWWTSVEVSMAWSHSLLPFLRSGVHHRSQWALPSEMSLSTCPIPSSSWITSLAWTLGPSFQPQHGSPKHSSPHGPFLSVLLLLVLMALYLMQSKKSKCLHRQWWPGPCYLSSWLFFYGPQLSTALGLPATPGNLLTILLPIFALTKTHFPEKLNCMPSLLSSVCSNVTILMGYSSITTLKTAGNRHHHLSPALFFPHSIPCLMPYCIIELCLLFSHCPLWMLLQNKREGVFLHLAHWCLPSI